MLLEPVTDWFDENGVIAETVSVGLVLALTLAVYLVSKRYTPKIFRALIERTETEIDDLILERVVLARLIYVMPFFILNILAFVFQDGQEVVERITGAVMAFIVLLSIGALIGVINTIYVKRGMARKIPIKSYLQLVKIFIYVVGILTILSQLTGNSPWFFISGVGVFTAILLLIFRDTILSFVASLQIASNDLFRLGDWIEVPAFAADGTVIDISLHTIKVQNWDKTITMIPTNKILEVSFRNWRGMTESGGRRIKRSIYIDVASIRLCDDAMLERLNRIHYLRDYMTRKMVEVEHFNREHDFNADEPVNGRRLTNVGTFRAYIGEYLKAHSKIHDGLTFLIRQLPPGPTGLPLEIYVFTNDTDWINYEAIQADIFDHLLAVAPEFGLRVFQNPTGQDFQMFGDSVREV